MMTLEKLARSFQKKTHRCCAPRTSRQSGHVGIQWEQHAVHQDGQLPTAHAEASRYTTEGWKVGGSGLTHVNC